MNSQLQICWRKDWVVDFDIKGLFDNIRHDYLIEMVKRHTEEQWIILYIERWLKTLFKMQDGKYFTSFLPAMSDKAQKAVRKEIRNWKLQLKSDKTLKDIANMFNSKIQGWINYYSHFYKLEVVYTLNYINRCLVKWVRRKYKKRNSRKRAINCLREIAKRDTKLFAHWKYGILATAV